MGNNPARAFPLKTLSISGSALVTSVHGRKGEMSPGLEPLCPFKKSCHLGHLCSLRHTTAHKYCQILFDSRSLCETGLSLPPQSKQTSLDIAAVCRLRSSSFFIFIFFLLGDFPLQVQSRPNLGWKGSQMQGGESLQATGGSTLPSSLQPL